MKRKFLSFVSVFVLICSTFCAGCFVNVTPVAFVTYKSTGEQYVQYSSIMYSNPQLYLYASEADVPNGNDPIYIDNGPLYRSDCQSAAILYIEFNRNLGADTIYETRGMYVDVQDFTFMYVTINKDNSVYSAEKDLYLNGTKLEVSANSHNSFHDYTNFVTYYFEDFGLLRTNSKGYIENIINTIEYK